jgi:hypothetical protein
LETELILGPDPKLITDSDPDPNLQIISDPAGFGSESTTLIGDPAKELFYYHFRTNLLRIKFNVFLQLLVCTGT